METAEIIKSRYYRQVLGLIKSVLPVIIYPNEPESLAVKICKIDKPEAQPSDAEILELTLINEQHTLEFWITQISLSGELGVSLKMQKRLDWVEKKLEEIGHSDNQDIQ